MQPWARSREVEKPKRITVAPDVARQLREVAQEVMRARGKFAVFNSAHEGYAVLLEEVDELWAEVVKRQSTRSVERMHAEARQVAAMAIRFLTDVNS